MAGEHHGIELLPVLTLLVTAVVAAPLCKRLGLAPSSATSRVEL
jgi:hypothetical protein